MNTPHPHQLPANAAERPRQPRRTLLLGLGAAALLPPARPPPPPSARFS